MRIVAISGSYQRGRTTDTLLAEALKGVRALEPQAAVETIRLIDRRIEYCRGCMVCRNDDPAKPVARCAIPDDMADLCRRLDQADGYLFACPMYEATVTAVMKCFLERICWVMARPGRRPMQGCPEPRNSRPKAAVCITSTGLIPGVMARLFGSVGRVFKDTIPCTLNAPIVGLLYACAVGMDSPRASERHLHAAFNLGQTLVRRLRNLG